jgi:pilus assembly protein FimV
VQAEESSWLSNPVLWIAIALIVLAVGSMVLLPLIRRPARPKPAVRAEGAAAGAPEPAAAPSPARTQVREPLSARREVAASAGPAAAAPALGAVTAAPAAPPRAAEPLSKPAPRPAPKPAGAPPSIDQLLKDIDIGLGQGLPPAAGAVPAAGSATRLPDAEPATASVTRAPSSFAPAPSKPPTAPPPRMEPPSAPQPDKLDFDFGDLGFEKAPPPSHLPPLEIKPAAPVPTELPPLELGVPEPELSVRPAPAPELKPSIPKVSDLKFEFTDVSQELGRAGAQEDLKLDKTLESFSADMLDLGKMEAPAPGGGEAGADYVETKLDLATAYLDMGDQVGARSLLDDVLREGDASQKKRAGELLKSLS